MPIKKPTPLVETTSYTAGEPAGRQVKPKEVKLQALDPSIVYLPPPDSYYSVKNGDEVEHLVGGESHAPTTSLIFETVYNPAQTPALTFAVSSGNKITYERLLLRGLVKVVPAKDPFGILARGGVLLPSAATHYESESALDAAIDSFIVKYCEISSFYRKLMRSFVKMSWVFDRFRAVPYLNFRGQWGSGKTRLQDVAAKLCYRATPIAGSATAAVLFRLMERWHGVLSIDEADQRESSLYADIIKILNGGYRRGTLVYRCNNDGEPIPYDPYGPKLMSTRTQFTDTALESRLLTIPCLKKKLPERIACQMPMEFDREAQELRNKLLKYRFDNYYEIKADETKLRGSGLETRTIEIATPLFAVTNNDPAFQEELLKFLHKGNRDRRADSVEAVFVEAIRQLIVGKKLGTKLSVLEVAQKASELRLAQEPKAARQIKAANGEEPQVFSARKAGVVIRSLGFEPDHERVGKRTGAYFPVTEDLMRDVEERYPKLESTEPQPQGRGRGPRGLFNPVNFV